MPRQFVDLAMPLSPKVRVQCHVKTSRYRWVLGYACYTSRLDLATSLYTTVARVFWVTLGSSMLQDPKQFASNATFGSYHVDWWYDTVNILELRVCPVHLRPRISNVFTSEPWIKGVWYLFLTR